MTKLEIRENAILFNGSYVFICNPEPTDEMFVTRKSKCEKQKKQWLKEHYNKKLDKLFYIASAGTSKTSPISVTDYIVDISKKWFYIKPTKKNIIQIIKSYIKNAPYQFNNFNPALTGKEKAYKNIYRLKLSEIINIFWDMIEDAKYWNYNVLFRNNYINYSKLDK